MSTRGFLIRAGIVAALIYLLVEMARTGDALPAWLLPYMSPPRWTYPWPFWAIVLIGGVMGAIVQLPFRRRDDGR